MRQKHGGASRASSDRVYQRLVRNAFLSSPALGHHGPLDVPAAWRRLLGTSSYSPLSPAERGHIRTFAVPLAGLTKRTLRDQIVRDAVGERPPAPRADSPAPVLELLGETQR